MTGRILEKYTSRNGAASGAMDAPIGDQGEIDDLGSFGWLRGIRDRSLSLELRKANGNIVAIPYHAIDRFEFDPSEGISLSLGTGKIQIKGRNLNAEVRPTIRLFEGLTRHRVTYLRETDGRENLLVADGATAIDAIVW